MQKSISTPLWFSFFLLLLCACSSQGLQLPPTSPSKPLAIATLISTQTESESTKIPIAALTHPSISYPTKQVVLNYSLSGFPLPFDDILGEKYSKLVLYSDRQMIITGKTYKQKILTEEEINQFLSQLENLGFYRLETNQKHDLTDKLYDFGNNYEIEEMGLSYCVLIEEKIRELCAYDPYRKFLVPEMKNILQFLDEYELGGMTPYNSPDRILIKVEVGSVKYPFYIPMISRQNQAC